MCRRHLKEKAVKGEGYGIFLDDRMRLSDVAPIFSTDSRHSVLCQNEENETFPASSLRDAVSAHLHVLICSFVGHLGLREGGNHTPAPILDAESFELAVHS